MAATRHKSTFRFRLGDVSQLRTLKYICTLNFDNVAQSAAEILLFLISETNGRHIEIFHFDGIVNLRRRIPNFIQIGPSAVEL